MEIKKTINCYKYLINYRSDAITYVKEGLNDTIKLYHGAWADDKYVRLPRQKLGVGLMCTNTCSNLMCFEYRRSGNFHVKNISCINFSWHYIFVV